MLNLSHPIYDVLTRGLSLLANPSRVSILICELIVWTHQFRNWRHWLLHWQDDDHPQIHFNESGEMVCHLSDVSFKASFSIFTWLISTRLLTRSHVLQLRWQHPFSWGCTPIWSFRLTDRFPKIGAQNLPIATHFPEFDVASSSVGVQPCGTIHGFIDWFPFSIPHQRLQLMESHKISLIMFFNFVIDLSLLTNSRFFCRQLRSPTR